MNQFFLPPDDLPPVQVTQLDRILRRQLEESISQRFYEVCGRITKALLSNCEWFFTTNASGLTLIISCPDIVTYWNIVSDIEQIGNRLERFSGSAQIRVCPPLGKGTPFAIRVDEISTYRDFF